MSSSAHVHISHARRHSIDPDAWLWLVRIIRRGSEGLVTIVVRHGRDTRDRRNF